MRIIVTGGGTGGHIYPALALIKYIQQKDPRSEFLYIGTTKGLESELVPRENIPFKAIEITGFKRSLSLENIRTVLRFIKGVRESKRIIKEFKPDVVLGTGGYVCGPVVYVASKLKIPTVIHEQNSVPGLTNKFLSKYVDKVAICFKEVEQFFPIEKVVLTGNPRASEVIVERTKGVLENFQLQSGKPTVLITGGSRGASPINQAVLSALPQLQQKSYQVIFVTGKAHYDQIVAQVKNPENYNNVAIVPFIHEMEKVLPSVDVVVGRAGATSLAELTALGIPSILIPSPYVTNNHQEKNAKTLVSNGAAIMITEKELSSTKLVEALDTLLLDRNKRYEMAEAAKQLGMRDASERLANVLFQLVHNP